MNKNELLTVLDEGLSSGWISKSEYDYEKLVKEREEKEKEQLYAAFKKGKRTAPGSPELISKGRLIFEPQITFER